MPLLPTEEAPRSMTRRNYRVELNRLRVKAYEPTRKALEDEDLKLAQEREEQRKNMLCSWKSQFNYYPNTTRPLPGGGPRSKRMKEAATIKNPNTYKIIKEEEAQLKSQRTALYKAEMQRQLKEREDYLHKWRADEDAYVTSLVKNCNERARHMEQREREDAQAVKDYMNRMRETNIRELEQKRLKQKEREEQELHLIRSMQEEEKRKAENDERCAKDMKRLMQLENEENHRLSLRKKNENKAREEAELKTMLEHNAALAELERQEQMRKKEQYRAEFEETIAKQKEMKDLYNYDEPLESIRNRNKQDAESFELIKQEERLRLADRRRAYRGELMQQIREKQEWKLEHLDGV